MTAASTKATRQIKAAVDTKPPTAFGNFSTAPLSTNSMGIITPDTPTGTASEIHVMQAHATTASVALPATERPSGVGITSKIRKNAAQEVKNPTSVFFGFCPAAAILSINCLKKPVL